MPQKEMFCKLRCFISVSQESVGIIKHIRGENEWLPLGFREEKGFNDNQKMRMRTDLLGLWDHLLV